MSVGVHVCGCRRPDLAQELTRPPRTFRPATSDEAETLIGLAELARDPDAAARRAFANLADHIATVGIAQLFRPTTPVGWAIDPTASMDYLASYSNYGSCLDIFAPGDNILSASQLYGGTYNLFAHTFPQQGITVRFADPRDPAAFAALIDERTKAIYCESIGNPLGNVTDIGALAAVAHAAGVPLIVDNTVTSPYLCRPFEHGADIVVHSLTKYLGGHGTTIGGAIVDSGKFPWAEHKARFKRLNEPDVSYHGVVYTEALGAAAYIGRARVVPLRNTGAAISPFNAFLILQGIETLALRMDRINANSLAVAQFLQQHPKVGWVNYAGLPEHPDHALAQKYLGGKASGLLTFGVKSEAGQGRAAGARFLDALGLFTRLVNIGDAKSLATHPASTTHRQLSPEELVKSGVPEDAVRLSVGIEHIDDLLADLDQALAQV